MRSIQAKLVSEGVMVSWAYCVRTYNVRLESLGLRLVCMGDVKKGSPHYEEVRKIQDEFRARDSTDGYVGYHRMLFRKGGRNTHSIRIKKVRKFMTIRLT